MPWVPRAGKLPSRELAVALSSKLAAGLRVAGLKPTVPPAQRAASPEDGKSSEKIQRGLTEEGSTVFVVLR